VYQMPLKSRHDGTDSRDSLLLYAHGTKTARQAKQNLGGSNRSEPNSGKRPGTLKCRDKRESPRRQEQCREDQDVTRGAGGISTDSAANVLLNWILVGVSALTAQPVRACETCGVGWGGAGGGAGTYALPVASDEELRRRGRVVKT
jgi:hypothetical protein